jgi:hypothetical protein
LRTRVFTHPAKLTPAISGKRERLGEDQRKTDPDLPKVQHARRHTVSLAVYSDGPINRILHGASHARRGIITRLNASPNNRIDNFHLRPLNAARSEDSRINRSRSPQ